jgi:hypothetical protein
MINIVENPSNFEWDKFQGFRSGTNADYGVFGCGAV